MNRRLGAYSSYLFATSGYIGGAARLFDFQGSLNTYNTSPTGEVADRRAMACDWKAIGEDLRETYAKYANEQKAHGRKKV